MYCRTKSATVRGVQASLIAVEVDVSTGLPAFDMVGLLSSEVKEARERVRTAIRNSGYQIPPNRITVNLSPADIRKGGNHYDLPIAIAILEALGVIQKKIMQDAIFVGELGLDGTVKRVNGILPMVSMAAEQGIRYCFVPFENRVEGAACQGLQIIPVKNLQQVIDILNAKEVIETFQIDVFEKLEENYRNIEVDFGDIKGQQAAKRGVKIAVAGMHNLLMAGPPGSGKTMLAKAIPGILPRLTPKECLEITQIYSVAGMLEDDGLIYRRPFRETHDTITPSALLGGGLGIRPGEATLAHRGVLFMDEYPQYPRKIIELLRQPLEERKVRISRVHYKCVFPADFQLVCAMNLCPCGHFPNRNRCSCTDYDIHKYLSKISGPILDRIDIGLLLPKVDLQDISQKSDGEDSASVREQIEIALSMQKKRFAGTDIFYNSRIPGKDIGTYCKMSKDAKTLIDLAYEKLGLSVRAYHKAVKVARTIADLEESECIEEVHMAEAVGYRIGNLESAVWGMDV